jgi:hypothetical protein
MTPATNPSNAATRAETDLVKHTAALRAAEEAATAARERLAESVVAALLAGVKVPRAVELTGYSREHVRRIARAAGVRPSYSRVA